VDVVNHVDIQMNAPQECSVILATLPLAPPLVTAMVHHVDHLKNVLVNVVQCKSNMLDKHIMDQLLKTQQQSFLLYQAHHTNLILMV
jgi:hypothetical protein